MPIAYLGSGRRFPVWDEFHQKANARAMAWANAAVRDCTRKGEILGALEDAGAINVHRRPQGDYSLNGRVSAARFRFKQDGPRVVCNFAWVEMENPDCP